MGLIRIVFSRYVFTVFYRKNPLTPLIVLCARSCAKSCALGLVRTSCAHVLCGFQNVCEPQTSCARCCADVVRVLCVVFGGDWLWVRDIFSGGLVRSCAGVLGGTIPHKTPHNTLYLDKVLCASCVPVAFAKKVLCVPCAEFVDEFLVSKSTVINFLSHQLVKLN